MARQASRTEEELRRYRHETSNHLLALSALLEIGEMEKAKEMVREIVSAPAGPQSMTCGNPLVDAVIGQAEVGIEVKSSKIVTSSDTKGLKTFSEEYPDAKLYLLSMEERPRKQGNIEIWPVEQFLKRLWNNQAI